MFHSLAFTEKRHKELRAHLHSGDGMETAAIILCHHGQGKLGLRLLANKLILVPADDCPDRTTARISWPFADYLPPEKITEIDKTGLSIITAHSHPHGYDEFSPTDNRNDKELFPSICNWFDDGRPNGSAIMLPSGEITARLVDEHGKFTPMESVSIVGESIRIWKQAGKGIKTSPYGVRIAQTFGKGTYNLLRKMRVGVVGCSGTGSIMVELLARNCIGSLVIIDPDHVEEKNLNRIINARGKDAKRGTPKVEVLEQTIKSMGTGVRVNAYNADTTSKEVIEALTDCDVIFGCVDSAEGRYHLECIANAYLLPYFDVGVNLEADHKGGISQADAVVHYMHPGNTSLMSRGAYTSGQVTAEGWRRTDKKYYEKQRLAGYLAEVDEDQPAVMSINMQATCMAFNDFLSRIHNFRLDSNADFATQRFRLVHGHYANERAGGEPSPIFEKHLGMGERSFLIRRLKYHANQHK